MSERKRYYNPMLDARTQALKVTPEMREAVINLTYDAGGPLNKPDLTHPYNLVSSLCEDGLHRPALDIDIPCRFVESSTPGHGHLYFDDLALDWTAYKALLGVLAAVGILENAYVQASLARGQTLLRPEHVRKDDWEKWAEPSLIDPDEFF